MAISDAREHLTEVVNRAVYAAELTYITRRGRRLAVVASAAQLEADRARVAQQAVLDTCRRLWAAAADADDTIREHLRQALDRIMDDADDFADQAVVLAVDEDAEHGAEAVTWDELKADPGDVDHRGEIYR
jgi:prevent-host-death family protein